jgi:signal transduction histidine kinase/CheY-like chemotaxis protein
MDGAAFDSLYIQERRRRLAAERMLERARGELSRAHSALVANADRLSRRYLSEREHNLSLSERQEKVLAQRKEAADRADRARRRLWHALEAMRDGFAVFDASGRLVAANQGYLRLFEADGSIGPGSAAEEMFTLAAEEGAFDIGDLEPGEWAQAHCARWNDETIEPLLLHHYDGRTIRLQDRRAPDGDVVSLAVDVTDESDKAAALTEAKTQAEAMAQAKAEFLARMSHEIRTPLNGVMGLADLVMERDETDEEGRLYARTIRESAEALLVIVNDTLDVSKLEAGRVELREEVFDLEALLSDCLRLVEPLAKDGVEVGLSFPLLAPTRLRGDAGRIRQVAMNLLSNALRFTTKGRVTIEAGLAVTGGATAEVTVAIRDTGPGIAPEEQERVFQTFAQTGPVTSTGEGTGLGLTIARGLAERMGGTLTLRSVEGEGSCFSLRLTLPVMDAAPERSLPEAACVPPLDHASRLVADRLRAAGLRVSEMPEAGPVLLSSRMGGATYESLPADAKVVALGADAPRGWAPRLVATIPAMPTSAELLDALAAAAAPDAPQAADLAAQAPARPRLLLADDNQTNRLLLDRMLRSEPFEVEIVSDGAEAVAAYAARPADVVVLDISMPVLDGFSAAEALRAAHPDCAPILALTAHTGSDIAERLRTAGFAAHLTKPLKKQVLLDAISRALDPAGH